MFKQFEVIKNNKSNICLICDNNVLKYNDCSGNLFFYLCFLIKKIEFILFKMYIRFLCISFIYFCCKWTILSINILCCVSAYFNFNVNSFAIHNRFSLLLRLGYYY